MCMFCAAIPIAATTGVSLNSKQLKAKREAQVQSDGVEEPKELKTKPIMTITAGVVVLLLAGSVTYHSLTGLPY
ncbi:MAG: hypothetical protein M1282_19365 [Chloroflexi bacterium]|nr:hypothetical protein [Chloroflexota bacterium]